jgi:hypothetical protein
MVPCPRCNPDDDVHESQPPPPMAIGEDGKPVRRTRCMLCMDARLVRPDVAARWREVHPLGGRAR